MSPTVLSGTETPASLAGGASPAGGTDVRSISTENIESIQIVRGIPSVEYGDLTSGAVIINTKLVVSRYVSKQKPIPISIRCLWEPVLNLEKERRFKCKCRLCL